jgi:hypothetical protein
MAIPGGYVNSYLLLSCLREGEDGAGTSGCCAGVRGGTTIQTICAAPIVTTTIRTTGTTTSGSVWSLPRRALFEVRTAGWEFGGCTDEESRPAPVMAVTPSENQPGSDSLVDGHVERLSDLQDFFSFVRSAIFVEEKLLPRDFPAPEGRYVAPNGAIVE